MATHRLRLSQSREIDRRVAQINAAPPGKDTKRDSKEPDRDSDASYSFNGGEVKVKTLKKTEDTEADHVDHSDGQVHSDGVVSAVLAEILCF